MENILCIRTETFLEKKRFFFKNQFCFIKKHSTDYAVQFLTTLFNDGLDKHFKVVSVFSDILKTFDFVDHEILWCKVEYPGIRGRAVNLLRLYLSDRKLYLNDRDQAIQGYYVESGDKQGSHFRTQLFSLPHFIILDHQSRSIVVGVRGTKSINDVITDLTCDNVVIIEQRRPMYMGHRGKVECATRIKRQIKDILLAVLEEHSNYGLVVTGHSLGAGVAAILSLLLRNSGSSRLSNLRCFAFSPPGINFSSFLHLVRDDQDP
ncbi:hypothetical protein QYM36_006841 [Artemia franciscana]|uniref:sn-1-specific diacylglycerol lipase n=1 Tax=Artemia franciscana TaxID=6661 RepID=A0AA88L2F6_ARTSF|nr:hypothetical protein QYM36_006841 [Artemia franciscana]